MMPDLYDVFMLGSNLILGILFLYRAVQHLFCPADWLWQREEAGHIKHGRAVPERPHTWSRSVRRLGALYLTVSVLQLTTATLHTTKILRRSQWVKALPGERGWRVRGESWRDEKGGPGQPVPVRPVTIP